MNKVNMKYALGASLIIFVVLFACKFRPAFAEIDFADERANILEDMAEQREVIGEIEDIFLHDDLSDEQITQVLNGDIDTFVAKKDEDKKPKVKKEPVVVQPKAEPVKVKELVKVEEPVIVRAKVEPVKVKEPVKVEEPVVVQPKAEPVKVKELVKVVPAPKKEVVVLSQPKVEPVKVAAVKKETVTQTPAPARQAAVKKGHTKPAKKVSLKELQARLSLTDAQMKRLTPIMKQKGERRLEIIKKYAGKGESARAALMREMELFREYYDNMYSHIMNEDQWTGYLELREEQKGSASS
ncbi:MAG: hypothetical protein WC486_03545 [Candidatus Omnitrophota bacterium]